MHPQELNLSVINNLNQLFSELFPEDNHYRVSLSWSSLGFLDLFLRPFRLRLEYNQNDLEIIKTAAIFCGEFILDCLKTLGENSYTLEITALEVRLVGEDTINLYPALVDKLQFPLQPADYLVQFSTTLTNEESIITNWIREIIVEKIASLQSDLKQTVAIWEKLQLYFSESILNQVFSDTSESKNQLQGWSKLFLAKSPLLLPPFEVLGTGRRYEDFFRANQSLNSISKKDWEEISDFFISQADPELGLLGSAIRIALDKKQTLAGFFSDRKLALETGEVIRNFQTSILNEENWVSLLKTDSTKEIIESLNWERARGLTPFLTLDSGLIGFPILKQLFFDLAAGGIEAAKEGLNLLIPKSPPEVASQLLLQQLALAIEFIDLDAAEEIAQKLTVLAPNFTQPEQALFFYLCGRLQLLLEESDKARPLFQRALSFGRFFWTDDCLIYFLSLCYKESDYQTVLLLSGDYGFLKVVDVELVLLKILTLEKLGRIEEAKKEFNLERDKAPFFSKLFVKYLGDKLEK